MAQSNAFEAIKILAKQINTTASNLNSALPQAASSLMNISMNLEQLNDKLERQRIDSILEGTHPSLQPIKRLLRLQGQKDHMKMLNLVSDDDRPLSPGNADSPEKVMFQRFIGVFYRRMWAHHGVEDQVLARRLFKSDPDCMVDGYHIEDGNMVFTFEDNGGFKHKLLLTKLFGQSSKNEYKVTSLWLDETFDLEFDSIGQKWLHTNFIEQISEVYEIKPSEVEPIKLDDVLDKINQIEGIEGICQFHKMTMRFDGEPTLMLPAGRVDVSYHYYAGSDKYQLTINFYPEGDRRFLGLHQSSHQHVTFDNLPTYIQQWINDNLEGTVLAKIEEVHKEREGDNS
jgi:hypothetical protein